MRARTFAMGVVVAVLFAVAAPGAAIAWPNGGQLGNGFGAHDWVLFHAKNMAKREGATWLNYKVAQPHTDDPDTITKNPVDHNYDRWNGEHLGNADRYVAYYYARTVSYLRKGDKRRASIMFAMCSHYYADCNQPMHTEESGRESMTVHTAYEHAVDLHTHKASQDLKALHYDGYVYQPNPAKSAQAAAAVAHKYYSALLGNWLHSGYNRTVTRITNAQLNRSANGIADLLVSAQQDAALGTRSPSLGAGTESLMSDGNSYYVADPQGNVRKFDAGWHLVASTRALETSVAGVAEPRLAAGCAAEGNLYIPVNDAAAPGNSHILILNAGTLARIAEFPASIPYDISALTEAPGPGGSWMLYAATAQSSSHLWRMDRTSGASLGTLDLRSPPAAGIRGLAYRRGVFVVASAPAHGLAKVYKVKQSGKVTLAMTSGLDADHMALAYRGAALKWLISRDADPRAVAFKLP